MNEGVELAEVNVKGAFSGQRRALQMQKSSMGVTNVVSADQVGKFSDSNIGDALKRINGINVQYDQGEARFGQVRGTSADLTSVTVNGNRLPSAEGDTRNVQLDLIPADMVQTIEVSKVVTSDMDGDAIGSAINLVTKNKAGSDDNKSARLERQQTMDFTLDGEHNFGNLKMDWASSYSRATEDRPNERYIGLKLKGSDELNFGDSFKDVGLEQPYSTLPIPAFNAAKWKIDEFTNSDQAIKENEFKERINFTLPISKGLYGNTLKFGYKYTVKKKERNTEYYDYSDTADKFIPNWQDNLVSEVRDGFMPGSQYPIGTQFLSKDYMGKVNFDKADGVEVYEEEAGNFKATEQIHAGYIRFDQKLGNRLDATLGLRIENTRLKTSGVNYIMDEEENESLKPTGEYKNDYTNLLPSLLLKYKTSEDGSIRASVTKTLSRPKYSALVANKSFNLADQEATIGDPKIKPTTAWNIDLSIDHYFKSIGMVSLGLFYKDVKNVNVETLGYYTGAELGLTGNNETFEVTQNMNAYDARVYGVEAAFQRDFGFIAPSLRCLGFYGNYTYTHSTTRNYNTRLGIEDGDDVKMAGSPEHTANASIKINL